MFAKLDLTRLPLLLGYVLGFSSTIVLPIWLGIATQRFALSSAQSGALGSLELGCVALASLLAASLCVTGTVRSSVVTALGVSLLANLAAAFSPTVLALAASRAVVGLAHGVLLADTTRRVTQRPDAQKIFAAQQFALVAFAVTFFASAPALIRLLGPGEPFVFVALIVVLTLGTLPALRSSAVPAGFARLTGSRTAAANSLGMAFASHALTFCLQAAAWAYLAQSAQQAGLGVSALSTILAFGSIGNLIAPLAASMLSGRVRQTGPLVTGFAGLALTTLGLGFGKNPTVFAVCAIGLTTLQIFLVPWLLGVLLALDPSGRATSAGPAFFTIGSALGPIMGGAGIAAGGLGALGVACASAALLALLLVTVSIRGVSTSTAPRGDAASR